LQEVSVPEGAGVFIDFDQVDEMAGIRAQRFRLLPAEVELAEAQPAAKNTARKAAIGQPLRKQRVRVLFYSEPEADASAHCAHQLIRVEAALHQRLDPARSDEPDRLIL